MRYTLEQSNRGRFRFHVVDRQHPSGVANVVVMSFKTRDEAIIRMVADRFAAILREWLTPAEFAEMKRRNESPDQHEGVCASADFCDSNMAMDSALRDTLGRPCDVTSDADVALWNAAWNVARERHLGRSATP